MKPFTIPLSPSRALRCVNLRPSDSGDFLVPALPPVPEAVPVGWRPLTTLSISGATRMLVANGTSIGLVSRGTVPNPIALDGTPLCVTPTVDGVIVMTRRRPYRFHIDANSRLKLARHEIGLAPVLETYDAGTVPVAFRSTPLSHTYTSGEELSRADRSAIIASARNFYREATRRISVHWHPVLAYTRGVDSAGNEVFSTDPVLLSHPSGKKFNPLLVLDSTDNSTVDELTVDVPTWGLRLVAPDVQDYIDAGVANVEVYVSPLIHSVDIDAEPTVERPRRASVHSFCSVALAPSVFAPASAGGSPSAIASLFASAKDVCDYVNCIPTSSAASGVYPAFAASLNDPSRELARLLAVIKKPVERASYVDAMLAAPHVFSASSVATSSGSFVWAGLEVERFTGWDPRSYAAAYADSAWHACVEVEFADGTTVVKATEDSSRAPIALSPLLSYPAPDAVAMTFTVAVEGRGVASRRFPLSPDPTGRRSVFIDPSMEPVALTEQLEAYVIPAVADPVRINFSETVAVGSVGAPLRLTASCRLTSGTVNAIAPMHFGQSSWDYGRTRFYVFTSRGIHMLSCDSSRKALSLSLIDNRIVNGSWAITDTEEGLAAIASGDVVLITGSNARTIARIPSARGLTWVHDDHELWCLTPEGVEVVAFCHDYCKYTLPLVFESQNVSAGCLIDQATKVVYRAGHGASAADVDVEWEGELPFHALLHGRLRVSALMSGTFSPMALSVSRLLDGRMPPTPDFTTSISGALRSPLIASPRLPPAHAVAVSLRGKASSNSVFTKIVISPTHECKSNP